jgi:hypothetical protein
MGPPDKATTMETCRSAEEEGIISGVPLRAFSI